MPVREPGDRRIRIGLVHGQTFDIEGHQTNFPIGRGIAEDRGFDYLAIGDTHAFREVEPESSVPTVYPSAPEATNFGETDTGYVAMVFFPRDRTRRALVERERVGVWSWRDEKCGSMADLRALRVESSLSTREREVDANDLDYRSDAFAKVTMCPERSLRYPAFSPAYRSSRPDTSARGNVSRHPYCGLSRQSRIPQ